MKKYLFLFLSLVILLVLTGCAKLDPEVTYASKHVYDFWDGIWHGLIIPFSWVGSLFSDTITIYGANNNGGWYNFGFVISSGAFIQTIRIITNILVAIIR